MEHEKINTPRHAGAFPRKDNREMTNSAEKMRIGTLCHSSCGGSTQIATELSRTLAMRGHRMHLFSQTHPFGCKSKKNGVIFHDIGRNKTERRHPATLYRDWTADEFRIATDYVIGSILKHRLHVLHFHYAFPFAFVAAKIKSTMGQASPVIIGTLHGTDVTICISDKDKRTKLLKALGYVDALTTVSNSHARLAADVLKLPEPPEVIPNFVDLSNFSPDGSKKFHLKRQSKPKIIHISNFRPVKNVESLAHIFLGIRRRMDAELWLIGDGPKMDTLKAAFHHSPFSRDVHYWGLRKDVAPILKKSDLLLVTSKYESFCLVALEAMASGVPVLATKVGGLPEVLVHGETGFLFQYGDIPSAVDSAVSLLSKPARHDAMRQAALRRARHFSVNRILPLYENLYEKNLNKEIPYNHDINIKSGKRKNESGEKVRLPIMHGAL
jgi:N-acetyl-alpha-D-glucosaminyl L-malate synthase BshA